MKHVWKMLMALLLVCALLVPAGAMADAIYGAAKLNDVPVMSSNGAAGYELFTIDKGDTFEIKSTVTEDGVTTWYMVYCKNPETGDTWQGYIRAQYVQYGVSIDDDTTGTGTGTIKPSTDSTLKDDEDDFLDVTAAKITAKTSLNVGMYDEPGTDGDYVMTIPANVVVDVVGMPKDGGTWYRVSYNGKTGYVPASMLGSLNYGAAEDEEDDTVYTPVGKGKTYNTNGVNLRKAPSTSADTYGKLVAGIEVELLSIPEKVDSNHWYMVRYDGKVGYIQAPYIKVLGEDDEDDKDDEDTSVDLVGVYGEIVNTNGVNLRKAATKNSDSQGLLKAGTYVQILQIPEKFDTNHWYKVKFEEKTGYIQAPYVKVLGADDEEDEEDDDDTVVTPVLPEGETKLHDGVIQNTNGVKFREGPGTNYEYAEKLLPSGTKVDVLSPLPKAFDKDSWFKVFYNGKVGYINAPYVYIKGVTDAEETPDKDDEVIDPDTVVIKALGVIQNTNGVNFRAKPDKNSESYAKLSSGKVVEVVEYAKYNSSDYWFTIRYDGKIGYIQAPYVYVAGLTLQTPPPDAEPDDKEEEDDEDVLAKGVIQNTNGVRFRKAASLTADTWMSLKSGVKVDILAFADEDDEDSWWKIRYDGKVGYILAPYVREWDEDEEDVDPDLDASVIGTGVITSTTGVNLREEPSTNSKSLAKLSVGKEVYLLKIPAGTDTNSWFKIRVDGKDGYVQAPYVVVLTGEIPESGNSGSVGVGVVTSTNGVNFRTGPSKEYGTMGKIPFDTPVELLSVPKTVDEDHWYKVVYNGKSGYVQSPYIRVVSIEAGALPDMGYAKLLESSANLRDSASGNTVVTWKGKGSLLRIAGDSITNGYYEWIPVFYPADSSVYYVRADMVQIVTVENGAIVTPTPAPASRYGYVLTTGQNVNLRIQPDEESIAKIPKGTVLVCVDDPLDPKGSNYTWYEVVYNGMYGYVRGDYVVVCDRNGTPVVDEDDNTGDDTEDEVTILGYIKVTPLTAGNRVHLRDKQAGTSKALLDGGLILPVIEEKTAAGVYGQYGWYKVKTADGMVGYVRDDCAVECDASGNVIENPEIPEDEVFTGYVLVTGNSVYVRQSPFGVGVGNVANNDVCRIAGETKKSNNITWYYIKGYDLNSGKAIEGYIHGDYVYKLTDAEATKYEADPTYRPNLTDEPEIDTSANHVITVNTNGLNLRASYSQDSNSLYKVKSGVVMEYIGTKQVGTVTWYNVIYKDIELWAHGDYLEVMTEAEYKAYLAQNPDYLPSVADKIGYVVTTVKNAPVLNAADGSKTVTTISTKGTVLKYYTEKISAGGEYWYRVYADNVSKFGYINAEDVDLCDEYGQPLPEPVPDVSNAPKSQQETSYSTLRKGNSGDAVANLVQELINQGYYEGKVTSSYTTEIKAAVELFQEMNGLDADGIADSATQHALFGTVPIGAGDTSNLSFNIYKVEKIDWFEGGIQQLLPKGCNFKIYDVKTGKVWWAHRWSGAYHADIETLTKKDSKTLCEIYGVDNLQEIVDENMWERRPCLVTIGTRTFACSLDGMQHNPDGDTIGNNGMDGQICLHFTNSLGHSSGAVSESHSEAIHYAYYFDYSDRKGYMGE